MVAPKKKTTQTYTFSQNHTCLYRVVLYSHILEEPKKKEKERRKTRKRRTHAPKLPKRYCQWGENGERVSAIGGWNMEVNAGCPSVSLSVSQSVRPPFRPAVSVSACLNPNPNPKVLAASRATNTQEKKLQAKCEGFLLFFRNRKRAWTIP